MASIVEVTTSWNIPSGVATKSYMYFGASPTIASIRAALGTFWNTVSNSLSNGVYWSVDPVGKILDDATGSLTGEWTDSAVVAGQGKVSGQVVADATQVNLQWGTGEVIGGRFVNGRTYIPGLAVGNLSGGNLAGATRTSIEGAGTTLAGATVSLGVWHRPKNGAGGHLYLVDSAICRSELAVLRGRRNR